MSEAELFEIAHPIQGWLLVDMIRRGTTSLPGQGGGEDEDRRQTAEEFHVVIGSSPGQVFGHFLLMAMSKDRRSVNVSLSRLNFSTGTCCSSRQRRSAVSEYSSPSDH